MDTPQGGAKSHGWGSVLVALVLACVLGLVALPGTAWSEGDSRGWMETGWQAYRSGSLTEAEAAFARAAAAAPGWATPAVWLGAVAMARRDWAAARRWFEAVLARHPTLAEAGYAEAWLGRLGIGVDRPRWRVRTVDEYAAFVRASNPALTLGQARWVGAAVLAAAARVQLDPRLLAAVVCIESRFEHRTISSAGAEGLGQLMPETAAALGVNPVDPWQNLLGAARLLRGYSDAFQSLPLALAAYNAGSAAVRQWGGIPPYPETQWYVWAVLWVLGGLSA